MNELVWQLEARNYTRWSDEERFEVEGFLRRHGVEPKRVLLSNSVCIYHTDDGLVLDTWQMAGEHAVRCPHCPDCVMQEPVRVPLVGDPPAHRAANDYGYLGVLGLAARAIAGVASPPKETRSPEGGRVGDDG